MATHYPTLYVFSYKGTYMVGHIFMAYGMLLSQSFKFSCISDLTNKNTSKKG